MHACNCEIVWGKVLSLPQPLDPCGRMIQSLHVFYFAIAAYERLAFFCLFVYSE